MTKVLLGSIFNSRGRSLAIENGGIVDPANSDASIKEHRGLLQSPLDFRPEDWLRFIQLAPSAREWGKLGLTDEDLRTLEVAIMAGPTHAPVLKNAGGLRKMRFGHRSANQGKSGAFRVCYVYFEEHKVVVLITIFGKNEKSNLNSADRNGIASIIRDIEHDLDAES